MTKRYDEPIDVTSDPFDTGAPIAFRWRGRLYEIDRSLNTWRETGAWLSPNGGSGNGSTGGSNGTGRYRDREYHRVLARPAGVYAGGDIDADGFMDSVGAVYDVYRDRAADAWKIARVWD